MKLKNLYTLNDLDADGKKRLKKLMQSQVIQKPEKSFNEFGLRFPIEYLNKIGGLPIMMPLEYSAEYVDIVTKTRIDNNDKDFIKSQLTKVFTGNVSQYNATSVGNLSYIALHCKDKKAVKIAIDHLEAFREYYFNLIAGQTGVPVSMITEQLPKKKK